jgi:FkbM family methyltransferase
MISYAQNFEDVMLWRALGHIQQGFYVDVGAHDPIHGSVSRLFYENGWRGVHVEPTPQYSQMIAADRPDETVVAVAIGDCIGQIDLTVFPDTGLTTAAPHATQQHIDVTRFSSHVVKVRQITLDALLAPYQGQAIHWLKIDIEGYEEQALKGWNSKRDRPWVMVLEATLPGSREPYFAHWEPILLRAGYQFAYFDGLNRFYVASEQSQLLTAFSVPPNFFDSFLVHSHFLAGQNAANAYYQPRLTALTDDLAGQLADKWYWIDRSEDLVAPPAQITCALCLTTAPSDQFSTVRSDCAFGGGRLMRHVCPNCDVIFGPQKMLALAPPTLEREYNAHYKIHHEGDSTASEVRAFFALNPQPGARYLNYGAGAWSRSVAHLRSQGWDVWGYEPHSSAVSSTNGATNAILTSWEQVQSQPFDGLFSNNVLEHLRHPVQDLQRMRGLLHPHGQMAHATPCFEYRFAYTRFHLFFFTGRSRHWLWQQAGLREVSFSQDEDFMCAVTAAASCETLMPAG